MKFNFSETCLLDVSGELPVATHERLQHDVQTVPAAMVEYELIKQRYEFLRQQPQPHLDAVTAQRMAGAIKHGVHLKLRAIEQHKQNIRRWQIAYRMMAMGSAVAAAVVVVVGVNWLVRSAEERRVQTAARTEAALEEFIAAGNGSNDTDVQIRSVLSAVGRLAQRPEPMDSEHVTRLLMAIDEAGDAAESGDLPDGIGGV